MLKKWDELPDFMRINEVRPYYEILKKKKIELFLKRTMDLIGGIILCIILAIPMIVIAVWIKFDSEGSVFYRQERIQHMGNILKFISFEPWLVMQIRLVQL